MIKEVIGNLLETEADVICHQVNCKGVMGAGIAKQIADTILTDKELLRYQDACRTLGSKLLGCVMYLGEGDHPKIANVFGQDDYKNGERQTNYAALRCGLNFVADNFPDAKIAIPGLIGCGLAGGDWEIVKNEILIPVFQNHDLTIVYWEQMPERDLETLCPEAYQKWKQNH